MSSHAASQRPAPPAPPALPLPPATGPRITPRRPLLLRALLYAAGVSVVVGAVAAGWALSTTTAPQGAPATSRPVALGSATVAVPAGWQPEAPSASGVAGLPDPAVALERLLGPLGTPRRSQLAGRPAKKYADDLGAA